MSEQIPPTPHNSPLMLSVISPPAADDPAGQQTDVVAHLANERTFLAWSFIAIIIIGSGVALARMLIALNMSPLMLKATGILPVLLHPTTMGMLFLGAGLIVMATATCRYLSVQEQISHQRYRPSGFLAMILLGIILALGVLLAGFLFQLRIGSS
jgi:putative membrane protein